MKPEPEFIFALVFDSSRLHINVTDWCEAAGKRFIDYQDRPQSQDHLQAVSKLSSIPTQRLVFKVDSDIWVHRKVAIDLAKWLWVEFEVFYCSKIANIWLSHGKDAGDLMLEFET